MEKYGYNIENDGKREKTEQGELRGTIDHIWIVRLIKVSAYCISLILFWLPHQ